MFHSIAEMSKWSDMNMARHHFLHSFPSLTLPPSPFLSALSSPTFLSCPLLPSTSLLLSSPLLYLSSSPLLSSSILRPSLHLHLNYLLLPLPACSLPSPVLFSTTRSFFFPSGLPSVAFPCHFLAFSVVNNEITNYLASPSSLFLTFTFEPGHTCLWYATTVWMRFNVNDIDLSCS